MKSTTSFIFSIIISSAGLSTAVAQDNTAINGLPVESLAVEDIVILNQVPHEVQKGSIKVNDDKQLAEQARVTINDAILIAKNNMAGKVIEAKLDDENNYLVWEITLHHNNGTDYQLKIDAGNADILALDTSENDEEHGKNSHFNWKFWDDDDHEERD